jgi:hypothetical protein
VTPCRTRLLRIPGSLPNPDRCSRPLTEPCLRYLRTRLLNCTFTPKRTGSPLRFRGDSVDAGSRILAHFSRHPRQNFRDFSAIRCDSVSTSSLLLSTGHVSTTTVVLVVTPFPPAALPAFIGTTASSDSLNPVCLPSFVISCPAYSPPCKRFQGLPGSHTFTMSDMPCSQTPGKR